MISFKDGVSIRGGDPLPFILAVVSSVLDEHGFDTIITSVIDGTHGRGSRHYVRLAMDFRTRHIPEHMRQQIHGLVKDALGAEFDVLLEPTHLHVEYDPKGPL